MITTPDAGHLVLSRPTIYPRADVVRDRLQAVYVRAGYSPWADEYPEYFEGQRRLITRFVIKAPSGRKVFDVLRQGYRPTMTWTATDRDGRPLPSGTYRLRVTVRDLAGNVRAIRRAVEVSAAQLEEQTWSDTMPAAEADLGPDALYPPGCNGCPEICRPVPSERFAGGLSFLQPCDFGYAAVQWFGAAPPFAPAPVDSFRVGATGGPPTLEGTGVGHLFGLDGVTLGPGDATATTPWTKVDLTHYAYLPDAEQPVRWGFSTTDGNDYDVASFTVEYRYYVPAG